MGRRSLPCALVATLALSSCGSRTALDVPGPRPFDSEAVDATLMTEASAPEDAPSYSEASDDEASAAPEAGSPEAEAASACAPSLPHCEPGGPGLDDCGSLGESCCSSAEVTGGTFYREAEWEFAAAGGSDQREYPWGWALPAMLGSYAVVDCTGSGCAATGFAPVGTATLGLGRWGQLDLDGNVSEWNLDFSNEYGEPCTDCAASRTPRRNPFTRRRRARGRPGRDGGRPSRRRHGGPHHRYAALGALARGHSLVAARASSNRGPSG
jgi:hypothetical protein